MRCGARAHISGDAPAHRVAAPPAWPRRRLAQHLLTSRRARPACRSAARCTAKRRRFPPARSTPRGRTSGRGSSSRAGAPPRVQNLRIHAGLRGGVVAGPATVRWLIRCRAASVEAERPRSAPAAFSRRCAELSCRESPAHARRAPAPRRAPAAPACTAASAAMAVKPSSSFRLVAKLAGSKRGHVAAQVLARDGHVAQRPGEKAARHRAEGDEGGTELAAGVEHRDLRVARPQRILVCTAAMGCTACAPERRVRHLREPDCTHLAGAHQTPSAPIAVLDRYGLSQRCR